MSIFDIFKKKESTETTNTKTIEVPIELTKKVSLAKDEVRKVCLTKKPLQNLVANVAVVLDYSGSMDMLYRNGTVQNTLEKLLPLAMTFDDNETMEVWRFGNDYRRLTDLTLNNLDRYLVKENCIYPDEGTNYAPVINDIVKTYKKNKIPAYIIFITDGDNWDKDKTTNAIKEASKYPIFWQFVGVGSDSFEYLQNLDDMTNRYVDNADFFKVKTMNDITYENLLNEFPKWLENPKVKDMLGTNSMGEIVYE
jgi:hypothetical protein